MGSNKDLFLLRKSPSLTLRIGRRLFSENSYKIRAMSNRPNSNVLFIMLMGKEILRVMIYWIKFCHADNSMQISEESENRTLPKMSLILRPPGLRVASLLSGLLIIFIELHVRPYFALLYASQHWNRNT